MRSNIPLPLSSDPSSKRLDLHREARFNTHNAGVFKDFSEQSPSKNEELKQNRAKMRKSKVPLGVDLGNDENASPPRIHHHRYIRQDRRSGGRFSAVKMPAKSLELSKIYTHHQEPVGRFVAKNINKRSVITEQWIKDRRVSEQQDTSANAFFSKFEPVPLHVRERDRMVASVMKSKPVLA